MPSTSVTRLTTKIIDANLAILYVNYYCGKIAYFVFYLWYKILIMVDSFKFQLLFFQIKRFEILPF
jgi:hypothetical protein